MTDDLQLAIRIATEAHHGQVDKAGKPYIDHPMRVMRAVSSPEAKIVAALHDVVEDCPSWPIERLKAAGFSQEIIDAINSVTRHGGETYEEFVERAAANPIGRLVKIADLEDNSDMSRISEPTAKDHDRAARYARALDRLRPSTDPFRAPR